MKFKSYWTSCVLSVNPVCVGDTGQDSCTWGSLPDLGMVEGWLWEAWWAEGSEAGYVLVTEEEERGTRRLILNSFMLASRPTSVHNFSLHFSVLILFCSASTSCTWLVSETGSLLACNMTLTELCVPKAMPSHWEWQFQSCKTVVWITVDTWVYGNIWMIAVLCIESHDWLYFSIFIQTFLK